RHGDSENSPLAASREMRGLAWVGPAGLDAVIRPDGNVRLFLAVAVEVPEQNAEGPVRIREPAFESSCDALPRVMRRLDGDHLLGQQKGRRGHSGQPA